MVAQNWTYKCKLYRQLTDLCKMCKCVVHFKHPEIYADMCLVIMLSFYRRKNTGKVCQTIKGWVNRSHGHIIHIMNSKVY